MPMNRPPLTQRQLAIYRFIIWSWGENGAAPTIREIGEEFGISSPNGIVCHLEGLHAKGYIRWNSRRADRKSGPTRARGIIIPELLEAVRAAAKELLEPSLNLVER